ncbi:N-acetylmuramoyl-L-alanine amidase [Paenibacillus sp. UNCCL117]|uniref:peptidoglycan recognition protein family protein n=1 Tax=unclassified Paenibacillus TaxID=185978 RepID=UPI00088D8E2C|nr:MULTISPECIES: peptidoglycan recognition family protein [unclassified Paenibacillus]SDC70566.1 N-acetylmuramoyl-L-alanine amidase [Paenibacillus sp. cl123]SFW24237.1 N-acetylmuramoyl-L-alanine amidase [Paenibacillus sp. UNCCL117]
MPFKQKYPIIQRYLSGPSRRRPCLPLDRCRFMVAHDTGNPSSTAAGNVAYYERSRNDDDASAHIFVDDKEIIECIPFLTAPPEKAWHVRYNPPIDNQMYGDDSNDCAGGVELCYGGKIDLQESYKRYVWVLAYACYKHGIPPTHIAGHYQLDPERKIDPKVALAQLGKTMEMLVADVVAEYKDCTGEENEMNKVLEYDAWAWEELDKYLGDAYNDGTITDWKWVQAARDKTLTYSELLLLKVLIDERRRLKAKA